MVHMKLGYYRKRLMKKLFVSPINFLSSLHKIYFTIVIRTSYTTNVVIGNIIHKIQIIRCRYLREIRNIC